MRILARIPGIIPERDENGRFIKRPLETSVVMVGSPAEPENVVIHAAPEPSLMPAVQAEPEISVIVPVYKNRQTLRPLAERVRASLPGRAVEIVFVNDACPDGSGGELNFLAGEMPGLRVLHQPENLGQTEALLRGLREARGRISVLMDADLQDPPEALPGLLEVLEKGGYGAVFAGRRGEYQSGGRMWTSKLFKAVVTRLVNLPPDAAGFVVFDAAVRERVLSQQLRNRYLPAMIGASSSAVTSIPVERAPRAEGQSAYSEGMRWSVALERLAAALELAWNNRRQRGR